MPEALLLAGVFAAGYLAFAWLALSQARHWRQVAGSAPPTAGSVRAMRGLGAALLGLAYALALYRDGPSFGTLLWVTVLSVAAMAVAFTLACNPSALRLLATAGRAWRRRSS